MLIDCHLTVTYLLSRKHYFGVNKEGLSMARKDNAKSDVVRLPRKAHWLNCILCLSLSRGGSSIVASSLRRLPTRLPFTTSFNHF